jgi:hypothetical protein
MRVFFLPLIIWFYEISPIASVEPEDTEEPSHDAVTGGYNVDLIAGLGNNKFTEYGECLEQEKWSLYAHEHPDAQLNLVIKPTKLSSNQNKLCMVFPY